MRTSLAALALLLGLAATAHAVIDGKRFERAAEKFSSNPATGRLGPLCVCQDGGPYQYHVGYLVKSVIGVANGQHVTMTCQLPRLTGIDRTVIGADNCLTYVILSR